MEYRRLGSSGLHVSALSLGSWVAFKYQLNTAQAMEIMTYAYDQGINFFDNAETYANGDSELIMGTAIKKLGWKRDTFLVSSKVFWGGQKPTQEGLSRKHVFEACHNALVRLQVDYLDLYFCHRPDASCPISETCESMNDLVRQGKVLYWGTSEWSATQLMEAFAVCKDRRLIFPTMEQPEYNMFQREKVEKEFLSVYNPQTLGLGTTVWSPLASGILSGKYSQGIPKDSRLALPEFEWLKNKLFTTNGPENIKKTEKLRPIAEKLEMSLATLAIAWCLRNPHVSTVILGASRLEQLKENLKALDQYKRLSSDIEEQIEDILQNKPTPIQIFKRT